MPNDWKSELDAIVGARHGGAGEALLARLLDLDRRHPNVPEILYQLAWSLDSQGKADEALPRYEKAVALGLSPNEHAGALLGIGTCHLLSKDAAKAAEIFEAARSQFPENREFEAFLALARFAEGRQAEALEILLVVLAETSEDPGIVSAQRTLRHLATRLLRP